MAEPVRVARPAVLDRMPIRGHHVVEASAGTGKTFLIEHRVVDLIVRGGARLEEILVVTFTEKATAELQSRIRTLIAGIIEKRESCPVEQPHWVIDEGARERLRAALMGFDRATISTIHGYCRKLVAEHAFSGGRQLRQEQVADVTAFERAFRAELRERLADGERYPGDAGYLRAWRAAGRNMQALGKLLYEAHCQVSRDGAPEPVLDAAALAQRLSALQAAAAGLLAGDAVRTLKDRGVNARTAGSIAAALGTLAELDSAAHPAQLCAALESINIFKLLERLEKCAAAPEIEAAAGALAGAAVPLPAAVTGHLLPIVRRRLAREKHEHGTFDFDDMLTQLWDALESPSGPRLAAELRRRSPYALIDEFQDTDELQWKIFRRVYLEGEGGHLSIIGDPKQAIYGFRGADVHAYLRAREEIGSDHLVTLDTNYRSTAALIETYNQLFDDFFTEGIDYRPVSAAGDLALEDHTGQPAAPVRALRIDGNDEKGGKLSAQRRNELVREALIADIDSALGQPLILRDGDEQEQIGPGDIFVLTRSAAEAREMADALRERGIPCALYQQEGLLTSRECEEVRHLLAAIADPRDRSVRLRAWLTRFFDLELGELGGLGELDDSHPLVARLYDWKELADRLDYERLLSSILSRSGFVERELATGSSERALTNVMHLFELLLADVVTSRCDIFELCRRLDEWVADAERVSSQDRNLQRLESDGEAVQIMTVHKSKGLEAALVYLYGGYGNKPEQVHVYHDGGQRLVHVGTVRGETKRRTQAEAHAEEERLGYVAITRAAGRVVAPYFEDGCAGKLEGYYGLIHQRLERLIADAHPGVEVRDPVAREERLAAAAEAAEASMSAPPLDWDPRAVSRGRRGFVVTSYTRLKKAAALGDRELSFDENAPLGDDELPGGAHSGIALHHVLEHVELGEVAAAESFDAWSADPGVKELARGSLTQHGIDPRFVPAVLDLVWRSLRTPVPLAPGGGETAMLAMAEAQRREIEFVYPLPGPLRAASRGYVRGYIDLLCQLRAKVYVVDWKSDVLSSYEPEAVAEHVDRNYRLQVDLYSIALARMVGTGERFGGLIYVFSRGVGRDAEAGGLYVARPREHELEARYAELKGVFVG